MIKYIDELKISEWEIETDTGFHPITSISKTVPYQKWEIKCGTISSVCCADTHIFFDADYREVYAKDLKVGDYIISQAGPIKVTEIIVHPEFENMYDVTVDSEDHRFWSNGLLSHNSTSYSMFCLHQILFKDNCVIAIMAQKASTAKKILSVIKEAYEHIPLWMQQGVVEWNKTSIELENGSKIIVSATSASAIRGISSNVVILDEFAFVPKNICDDFYRSVYPVISSGKTTKLIIVSTPNGFNMFYEMWQKAVDGQSEFKPISVSWRDVPGRDEEWKRKEIANTSEESFAQEYDCVFMATSNKTLISSGALTNSSTQTKPPLTEKNGLKIFSEPDPKKKYVILVDPSEGVNKDYHAFVVIDLSSETYPIVATFKNNTVPITEYPLIIYNTGNLYNEAFILVETNSSGITVANSLHYDYEYANLIMSTKDKKFTTQKISFGHSSQSKIGIKMSSSIKKIGCAQIKALIETDKLKLIDPRIIEELAHFQQINNSYGAEPGYNDDLAMCLVMFGWLQAQPQFKNIKTGNMESDIEDDNPPLFKIQTQNSFDDDELELLGYNPAKAYLAKSSKSSSI